MVIKRKCRRLDQRYRCHYLASQYTAKLVNSVLFSLDDLSDLSNNTVGIITGKSIKIASKPTKKNFALLNKQLMSPDRTPKISALLTKNITILVQCLQLNEVAKHIIQFAAVMTLNKGLNELLQSHIYFRIEDFTQLLSIALEIDELLIEPALEAIWSTGLLVGENYQTEEPVSLPLAITRKLVTCEISHTSELLEDILVKAPLPELSLKQFDYLDLTLMRSYLQATVSIEAHGINILLYGVPGTGKTQLARVMAHDIGADLLEVIPVGDNLWQKKREYASTETSGALRLQFNQLIQRLLSKSDNTLLLIDECEDLFVFLNGEDRISKESLHRLLETNILPTIWITNHIDHIDESCLRRFKMIVEFPKPSTASIKALIDGSLKRLGTTADFRKQLSCTKHLTMAHVDNAVSVIRHVGLKRKEAEHHIGTLIESTLSACGYQHTLQYQGALAFDLNFVNLSGEFSDLEQLIDATVQHTSARVLLTGAAGTGKTALVNHLAQSLDRELVTVRCSDILGKYVGESEKNVAKVFKEANESRSILFIDEVDSLLASRDGMSNSWEVQLVNELLTQIECFEQPLFAATNFHQRLDKAVLRRFDFKLHFAPLTTKQVLAMYRKVMHCKVIPKAIATQLAPLTQLTPGDFAIVARRQVFSTTAMNHQQALTLLVNENNRKTTTKSIGFVHPHSQG